MSPLFQRVHRAPLLPLSDQFEVFVCLVSVRLGRFMERIGVLPTTQFAYRKGLGTCDALLCASHTVQSALKCVQEARICRLISLHPLIGSTIREFYISSVMRVFEHLCCLY